MQCFLENRKIDLVLIKLHTVILKPLVAFFQYKI